MPAAVGQAACRRTTGHRRAAVVLAALIGVATVGCSNTSGRTASPTPPDTTSPPSGARDGEARSGAAARDRGPSPSVEDLAVPGYDSLAASQVVPRLGGLADEELADVRRYEETHRARRTILGRIAQLEAAGARDGRD